MASKNGKNKYVNTFDELLATAAVQIISIDVREKTFFIRELTSDEADEITVGILDRNGRPDISKFPGMIGRICRYGLVDSDGNQLIANQKEADKAAKQSAKVMRKLAEAILDHSDVSLTGGPSSPDAVEAEKNG